MNGDGMENDEHLSAIDAFTPRKISRWLCPLCVTSPFKTREQQQNHLLDKHTAGFAQCNVGKNVPLRFIAQSETLLERTAYTVVVVKKGKFGGRNCEEEEEEEDEETSKNAEDAVFLVGIHINRDVGDDLDEVDSKVSLGEEMEEVLRGGLSILSMENSSGGQSDRQNNNEWQIECIGMGNSWTLQPHGDAQWFRRYLQNHDDLAVDLKPDKDGIVVFDVRARFSRDVRCSRSSSEKKKNNNFTSNSSNSNSSNSNHGVISNNSGDHHHHHRVVSSSFFPGETNNADKSRGILPSVHHNLHSSSPTATPSPSSPRSASEGAGGGSLLFQRGRKVVASGDNASRASQQSSPASTPLSSPRGCSSPLLISSSVAIGGGAVAVHPPPSDSENGNNNNNGHHHHNHRSSSKRSPQQPQHLPLPSSPLRIFPEGEEIGFGGVAGGEEEEGEDAAAAAAALLADVFGKGRPLSPATSSRVLPAILRDEKHLNLPSISPSFLYNSNSSSSHNNNNSNNISINFKSSHGQEVAPAEESVPIEGNNIGSRRMMVLDHHHRRSSLSESNFALPPVDLTGSPSSSPSPHRAFALSASSSPRSSPPATTTVAAPNERLSGFERIFPGTTPKFPLIPSPVNSPRSPSSSSMNSSSNNQTSIMPALGRRGSGGAALLLGEFGGSGSRPTSPISMSKAAAAAAAAAAAFAAMDNDSNVVSHKPVVSLADSEILAGSTSSPRSTASSSTSKQRLLIPSHSASSLVHTPPSTSSNCSPKFEEIYFGNRRQTSFSSVSSPRAGGGGVAGSPVLTSPPLLPPMSSPSTNMAAIPSEVVPFKNLMPEGVIHSEMISTSTTSAATRKDLSETQSLSFRRSFANLREEETLLRRASPPGSSSNRPSPPVADVKGKKPVVALPPPHPSSPMLPPPAAVGASSSSAGRERRVLPRRGSESAADAFARSPSSVTSSSPLTSSPSPKTPAATILSTSFVGTHHDEDNSDDSKSATTPPVEEDYIRGGGNIKQRILQIRKKSQSCDNVINISDDFVSQFEERDKSISNKASDAVIVVAPSVTLSSMESNMLSCDSSQTVDVGVKSQEEEDVSPVSSPQNHRWEKKRPTTVLTEEHISTGEKVGNKDANSAANSPSQAREINEIFARRSPGGGAAAATSSSPSNFNPSPPPLPPSQQRSNSPASPRQLQLQQQQLQPPNSLSQEAASMKNTEILFASLVVSHPENNRPRKESASSEMSTQSTKVFSRSNSETSENIPIPSSPPLAAPAPPAFVPAGRFVRSNIENNNNNTIHHGGEIFSNNVVPRRESTESEQSSPSYLQLVAPSVS